jgi:hypothetical protein
MCEIVSVFTKGRESHLKPFSSSQTLIKKNEQPKKAEYVWKSPSSWRLSTVRCTADKQAAADKETLIPEKDGVCLNQDVFL